MKNNEWNHKDEWKLVGTNFCIVVSRHSVNLTLPKSLYFDEEGEHRWTIYAYIYPKHPLFNKFEGDDLWQDAADLDWHGGCSFLQRHESNNKVTSIQVGCDYNHLHDKSYTHMATKDDAWLVFNDAMEIFEKLKSMEIAE